MARRITVLSTEGGAEGIDSTEGSSTQLAFELSGNGERSLLTKEIIVVDNLPLLVLLQVLEVLGGYLEHVACTLTVRCCDQRCVEVEEAMLMEIGVDGHCHVMTDTHHSPKGIGTQTHVGILAHHLEALTLLLHRIGIVAEAIDLQGSSLDLTALSCTLALYECSNGADAGTSRDILQQLLVELSGVNHHLNVFDGRTIVEGDKVDCLRAAVRAHPTLHADFLAIFCALQHINNLRSFHCQFTIIHYS